MLPVQPVGLLTPGCTRTLHLYEQCLLSLLDDEVAKDQQLMAIAVLEPFMGDAAGQAAGLGAHVGGMNSVVSCCCLTRIIDTRPATQTSQGGVFVRVRGEARLGVSRFVKGCRACQLACLCVSFALRSLGLACVPQRASVEAPLPCYRGFLGNGACDLCE